MFLRKLPGDNAPGEVASSRQSSYGGKEGILTVAYERLAGIGS